MDRSYPCLHGCLQGHPAVLSAVDFFLYSVMASGLLLDSALKRFPRVVVLFFALPSFLAMTFLTKGPQGAQGDTSASLGSQESDAGAFVYGLYVYSTVFLFFFFIRSCQTFEALPLRALRRGASGLVARPALARDCALVPSSLLSFGLSVVFPCVSVYRSMGAGPWALVVERLEPVLNLLA